MGRLVQVATAGQHPLLLRRKNRNLFRLAWLLHQHALPAIRSRTSRVHHRRAHRVLGWRNGRESGAVRPGRLAGEDAGVQPDFGVRRSSGMPRRSHVSAVQHRLRLLAPLERLWAQQGRLNLRQRCHGLLRLLHGALGHVLLGVLEAAAERDCLRLGPDRIRGGGREAARAVRG